VVDGPGAVPRSRATSNVTAAIINRAAAVHATGAHHWALTSTMVLTNPLAATAITAV
jgi:hypothetical protein